MSEPVVTHQLFEYKKNEPFLVINAQAMIENPRNNENQVFDGHFLDENHWHEELEIAYIVNGRSLHYIDGVCVDGVPGRLVVTNSGSTHNIIREPAGVKEPCLGAIIVLIHAHFLREEFPQYSKIYFTNEHMEASGEISDIMWKLSSYAERKIYRAHDCLYAKGLILQLLYHMYEGGVIDRDLLSVNVQKNLERLKGVLTYIENYYTEPLTQEEIAKKFYFSKVYFSRYFKQCMGMTFTEYLVKYRLQRARQELLESDKHITEIALKNGFSDVRRFINSFKKYYGTTPFQYRKSKKQSK